MPRITVHTTGSLRGRTRVPADKSISHRALLLGCLANGPSEVHGFPSSGDCRATLDCVRALGIDIELENKTTLIIHGRDLRGLRKPSQPLDCGRSATTMRLLAGILAGQSFDSVLIGDPQLLRRPMGRIVLPLRQMGACITTTDGRAPLEIQGTKLSAREHVLPVASAQVKSAILLAGLYADGRTIVRQPGPARDHTERMLAAIGANVEISDLTVALTPGPSPLSPLQLPIPGDISSACFPLVGALLLPGSKVTVEDIGLNPTRTGLLDVLGQMGTGIEIASRREQGGEPVGDVTARGSDLHRAQVSGDTVVRMIDEFPLLAVAATQAQGATIVRDAAELRVKETDRIAVISAELGKMGADIKPQSDGFVVVGPRPLHGAVVDSHGDHRIAMALAVAALIAEGETTVQNTACIRDSFPNFVETMQRIGAPIT